MSEIDKVFAGSIPRLYEAHLVPLIFEPYARDMRDRVGVRRCRQILEVAAGTGVATRALAELDIPGLDLVATDLNPAMIQEAQARGTARPVRWQQADALSLPFGDRMFDAVVCQFGAMFFPDKPRAFAEARRVLRPGGRFFFSVWDGIEENEFADVVTAALATVFPDDPPRFLARTPHGYHDRVAIERHLGAAGFTSHPVFDTVSARSRAASPRDPAVAYCEGTPLRTEIEARGSLAEATEVAAKAMARAFGEGPVDGKIQAHVIEVEA